MDISDLQQLHIQPYYEVHADVKADKTADIFRHHASAVLWCAVASCYRRSSEFNADVRRVFKKWRKDRPKDAAALEQLLWVSCRDMALRCPWRPSVPKLRIITNWAETHEEYKVRVAETRKEWLRLMQELHDAMSGKRACKVVVVPPARANTAE